MLAVAGLAVVAVALLALLVLYGTSLLAKLVGNLIPGNLPIIGNRIRNAVEAGAQMAVSALSGLIDAAIGPLSHVITYPFYAMHHAVDLAWSTIMEALRTLGWVVNTRIPQGLHWAEVYAYRIVHRLSTNIWAEAHRLAADIVRAVRDAETYAYSITRRLSTNIWAEAHALAAAARADLATALAHADALFRTAEADALNAARAAEVQAEAAARAMIAAVPGILGTDIERSLAGVWGDVESAAGAAVGAAAGGLTDVVDAIRSIPRDVPADIAGEAAAVGAIALTLTRYLKDCGIPNCRNLGGLGNLLQDLFGALGDGALLAFLAELVNDPHRAADDIRSILGPVASGTADTVEGLLNAA